MLIKAPEIRNELGKYNHQLIEKFIELYPCTKNNYYIHYRKKIILKQRGPGYSSHYNKVYYSKALWIESIHDFWQKWNKFKSLIIMC